MIRRFSSKQVLKKFEDLPGPRSYPLIGNLPELKIFGLLKQKFSLFFKLNLKLGGDLEFNPFDKFCLKLHERYGDLVRWSILGKNNVILFEKIISKI